MIVANQTVMKARGGGGGGQGLQYKICIRYWKHKCLAAGWWQPHELESSSMLCVMYQTFHHDDCGM